MDKNALKNTCRLCIQIVGETGDFIRNELGKVKPGIVETKSLNSLVSYVDQQAEKQLVSRLSEILPGSVFFTEENTVARAAGKYRWVIDPLDGTTNFLHGLPCFAVSVALQEDEKTILGLVLEVSRDECFYAWKGGGAFCNGHPIKASQNVRLADSLIATGFPYYDFSRKEAYFQAFEQLMRSTRGIRRFGAAAVDLAYVACGRFDAFFEYSLQPWDIAAGLILVEEAGGKCSDFCGADDTFSGKEIIAGNAFVYPEFLKIIKSSFYPEK